MVKKHSRAVRQILIQWKNVDASEAIWEDYHKFKAKFPSFSFFANEEQFQEGRNVEVAWVSAEVEN